MLEIIYRNKMQFFALSIFLVISVILTMIPSVSAEDYDISITDDMKFNPEDLTINVDDTVTWTNNDGMGHTATSTDGPASFDSGNIAAGATWSFTFTEAGTYEYKCDYHSSMTASIAVEADDDEGEEEEDVPPRTDSDWFTWTMNGTHHSILAVTNESLNWTTLIVSIYDNLYDHAESSLHDFEINYTYLENGTHLANISLYNNDDIVAYHDWTFVIGNATENEEEETEESPDSDNDGISDDNDLCPEEDSSGHDADADGCIDDSDNDGVKNDVDECPFDPNDECLSTQEEEESFPEDVPGCVHKSAENYNPDATEDDESCTYEEDSPGFGFALAALGCLIITFRRKL